MDQIKDLITIRFNVYFNESIHQLADLPNLKNIHFYPYSYFDQPIDVFSELKQLEILTFGFYFNQKIDCLQYLKRLKTIVFGANFIQSIDNLPDSVENLILGTRFRNPFLSQCFPRINKLPKNLKKLKLQKGYPYLDHIKKIFNGELVILN